MSDITKEDYKGPGKFTAAYGRGATEGIVTGGIGAAVGAGIGAALPGDRKTNAKIGAVIGAVAGEVPGLLHGAVAGYKNADAAKTQVERLQEREAMRAIAKEEGRGK